ncbi:MAG: hypothetical protein IJW13_00885 [Clostridia bacterium]|nr:hypothetical protein [Clostridia bacterium]
MNNVAKTLLYGYPSYGNIIEGLQISAKYKAIKSFGTYKKTLDVYYEIMKLNDLIHRIGGLKLFIEELLEQFTPYEVTIIKACYFNQKAGVELIGSPRKQMRDKLKVEKKFVNILLKEGFDLEYFKNNYFDIYFIKHKYNKIVKDSLSAKKLDQRRLQAA